MKSTKTGRHSEYSRNMATTVAGAQQAKNGVVEDADKGQVR